MKRGVGRLTCGLVVLSAVGAICVVAACSTALSTSARAQAPVVDAPTLSVDDQWRWTNGESKRVVAVEGDLIVTTQSYPRCTECRAYRDKNQTIVKLTDKDGNAVNDPYVGYKVLDFPLTVGKRWNSDQVLRNRTTGVPMAYKNTFAVEAYEEVKTKAGTFKAFRITQTQQFGHTSFSAVAGRDWRATLWYSPEVGAYVKREVNTAGSGWEDWELESYSLSGVQVR